MDKLKNLYNINSKSRCISKTPAQDRLQSLQKRLQIEQKSNGILPINKLIKESSNQLTIGNFHSINKNSKNENKLNKKNVQKTSSIQDRLNSIKKQMEIDSSEKQAKTNNDNNEVSKIKLINSNSFEKEVKNNVNKTKYNNLEEKSQTTNFTVKDKINSVWESIKSVWNSNKNIEYKKLENVKQETQNQDLLLKSAKLKKEKYKNINSNSNCDEKIFSNKDFSIANLKKVNNKNDNKNILEPLCAKYTNIRETPKNDTFNKNQDNDKSIFHFNYESIQNKSKKRYSDDSLFNDSSKKLKLATTNEDLNKKLNETELKKKSNLIIPLSPSPNKKFSANSRLQNLREQLKVNQPSLQQLRRSQLPCSTIVESNINTAHLIQHTVNNNKNISNNDEIFERFDVVNKNLANLVKNNNEKNEFKKDYLYIVPDTNVFLNNLSFLSDLIKSKLCDTKGSILYIPYIVLQELDKLKMQKHNSISVRAGRAVNYLNENFESKNIHFKGQNAKESQKYLINIESPDDHIINCCLQLKSYNIKYILLSNDINLRNKAICNDIICSSKDNLES